MVQVYVLLTVCSRMLYLAEALMSSVTFAYQAYVQVYPFMFTSLAIVSIIKYKVHLLFVVREERAPNWVRFGLFGLQLFSILMVLVVPAIECSSLDNQWVSVLFLCSNTAYLAVLSITSLYVSRKLSGFLCYTTMRKVKADLKWLEVIVQTILVSRLIVDASYERAERWDGYGWVVYLFVYLILAEFIPFSLLIYATSVQNVSMHKQKRRKSQSTKDESDQEDKRLSLIDSELPIELQLLQMRKTIHGRDTVKHLSVGPSLFESSVPDN